MGIVAFRQKLTDPQRCRLEGHCAGGYRLDRTIGVKFSLRVMHLSIRCYYLKRFTNLRCMRTELVFENSKL